MFIKRKITSKQQHTKFSLLISISILFLLLSSTASASLLNWNNSFLLQGGFDQNELNPVVLVGFNPQPEPPAISSDRQPTFEFSGLNPSQVFNLGFAISTLGNNKPLELIELVTPAEDFLSYSFIVNDIENNTSLFEVNLEFMPSADVLIDLDTLSFNPQPEPPAELFSFGDVFGISFQFTSFTPMLDISMQVLDSNSNPIAFTEIPLNRVTSPSSFVFLSIALIILVGRMKKVYR